jgi:hypothetical protein
MAIEMDGNQNFVPFGLDTSELPTRLGVSNAAVGEEEAAAAPRTSASMFADARLCMELVTFVTPE